MRGHLAGVGLAMFVAACSTSPSETPVSTAGTTPETTAATVAISTTAPPPATTADAPETTVASGGPVGDPDALRAEFESLAAIIPAAYPDFESDPLDAPNFSDPDPGAALEAILAFDQQMIERYPLEDWTDLYTFQGSPASRLFGSAAREYFINGWVHDYLSEPALTLTDMAVSDLSATDVPVPPDVVSEAPDGAKVVTFAETIAPSAVVERETGEEVRSSDGNSYLVTALMGPSPTGWRLYWYELEAAS